MTIKTMINEGRALQETEDLFSFENDFVRVAVQRNGGAYARELSPGHGVDQTSVSNETTLKRLAVAWEKVKGPNATRSDFRTAGEKIRGVKFTWRSN